MTRFTLRKMHAQIEHGEVQYYFNTPKEQIHVNHYIGKQVELSFTNAINCISCGKSIKKTFAQGYCYPCFASSPETEECVLRPELCQAHQGVARDMEYAKNHCLIPHFVYLSETSGIKVGVTRHTQIPTRWIDQGAVQAQIIAQTPNRFLAGTIEVALKTIMADKTNWRKMLLKSQSEFDLDAIKQQAYDAIPQFAEYFYAGDTTIISYPGTHALEKVSSVKFDTSPTITDVLVAIKGQYLLFASGKVFNVRNHTGYELDFWS